MAKNRLLAGVMVSGGLVAAGIAGAAAASAAPLPAPGHGIAIEQPTPQQASQQGGPVQDGWHNVRSLALSGSSASL